LAGKPPSGDRAAAFFEISDEKSVAAGYHADDVYHQNLIPEEEIWDRWVSGRSSLDS
jgi:hypothetical protein